MSFVDEGWVLSVSGDTKDVVSCLLLLMRKIAEMLAEISGETRSGICCVDGVDSERVEGRDLDGCVWGGEGDGG